MKNYFNKFVKVAKILYNYQHEKKLFKLRKEVNELFFNHHFSKSMIAKKKKVSRNFVIAWTKSPNQIFSHDDRGWQKGKRRKWDKETERRIQTIYKLLRDNPNRFYFGATSIFDEWQKRYADNPPPLITIGRILSELGLSSKRKKGGNKGASRYLCYPEYTVFNVIARRVLELDFIGKKFIDGRTEPLNFIAASFKKEPRLRHYKRISGETADEIIDYLKFFFKRFEKPDAVKMDNGFAMAGSSSHPRVISRVAVWLLSQNIIPIYSVPRRPFSQASIEGNNSVFSRKFWNRIKFRSVREVDMKLEWFNKDSERYCHYQKPKNELELNKNFIPKIYFIRQVKEDSGKGFIEVSNDKVFLPKSYINYFVLAEWNLKREKIFIWFEREQKAKIIKEMFFKINLRSKEKLEKWCKI